MRKCSRCKRQLAETCFRKDRTRPSGLKSHCDDCRKVPAPEHFAGMGDFGTPIERECAEAYLAQGNIPAAAKLIGLEVSAFRAHLSELRRRAAKRGFAPASDMTKVTPEGFHVKGVSTLYDGEGKVSAQWVKTNRDEEHRFIALMDALGTMSSAWKSLADPIAPPSLCDEDLLCVYGLGDPHVGMMSWAPETGNNHDLAIAEQDLYGAVDQLASLAPASKQALIINVGDFFHADGRSNTTTGGTPVDSDGRWPKVLATGIRIMRRMIDRALAKHEHVTVINEIGNHDWHTSIVLSIALAQFYEREARVTIDTSPAKFHWYRFGANLIGTTHGDTVKLDTLGEIMAADRPMDWGETEYRYWYSGHIHHTTIKELRGCIVETLRTLAPADAWHRGQGYRSGQDMRLIVHHRKWGQINRHTVGIAQVRSGHVK